MAEGKGLFPYEPSHVLPVVSAAIVAVSLGLHCYQNLSVNGLLRCTSANIIPISSRYGFWRVTFFLFWGSLIYFIGWVLRTASGHDPANKDLFIAQTIFIYAAPPIYSAAAYNLVGRLLHYLPMFAPLNPNRVIYFFVYLGAAVEGLTGAGAAQLAASGDNISLYKSGGRLISVAIVLQTLVELLLVTMVVMLHYRCSRANMMPRNVRTMFITLYGTSTFVLLRCIFRAIESFAVYSAVNKCEGICRTILRNEWYVFVLEAVPMVLFTYWLNILHPGKYLPKQKNRYLDFDGKTERLGPGWTDKRSKWQTFVDPFDLGGLMKGEMAHDRYWLQADMWPVCENGSFAKGTATNATKGSKVSSAAAEQNPLMRQV